MTDEREIKKRNSGDSTPESTVGVQHSHGALREHGSLTLYIRRRLPPLGENLFQVVVEPTCELPKSGLHDGDQLVERINEALNAFHPFDLYEREHLLEWNFLTGELQEMDDEELDFQEVLRKLAIVVYRVVPVF
ncbi:unnamed protein product [Cuscuta campestris]|uniref:Uncharacterized protein n=1 Tax=Cuscuta campestris TaxID=132261 RepID=A0A484LPR5_9ASTE|nr:unnamed protein product [Cuscuta campestris]